MSTILKEVVKELIYDFDREKTWTDIHEGKKKYTHTGWLCGVEVATMDEPVKKMDEFLSKIHPVTLLIPDNLALTLYNTANNLAEFEGCDCVFTIKSGLGSAGTKKDYKFEDGWHQIKTGLHELRWYKCQPDWFAHYFCTPLQFQMVNHVFGRVPGVIYI